MEVSSEGESRRAGTRLVRARTSHGTEELRDEIAIPVRRSAGPAYRHPPQPGGGPVARPTRRRRFARPGLDRVAPRERAVRRQTRTEKDLPLAPAVIRRLLYASQLPHSAQFLDAEPRDGPRNVCSP